MKIISNNDKHSKMSSSTFNLGLKSYNHFWMHVWLVAYPQRAPFANLTSIITVMSNANFKEFQFEYKKYSTIPFVP